MTTVSKEQANAWMDMFRLSTHGTQREQLEKLLDFVKFEERQTVLASVTRYWNEADCFADYQGCKDAILNGYGED